MTRDPAAPASQRWRQRFTRSTILWARPLPATPNRSIVAIASDAGYHWHSWDIPSGALTPITTIPPAILTTLAPDGRHEEAIYAVSPDGRMLVYLRDHGGGDRGHFVCVPLDGRPPVDLTPDLPPYLSFAAFFNPAGTRLAFTAVVPGQPFTTYVLELRPDGTPGTRHTIYASESPAAGAWLLGDELAIVASTERTTPPNWSLVALDLRTGAHLGELWDGPLTGFGLPPLSSPVPGDDRLLTSTDEQGFRRPVLWNVRTGERSTLPLGDRAADIAPLCWSPDGARILLSQVFDAQQRLSVYDVATARTQPLAHPVGSYSVIDWQRSGEVLAHWQDASHPPAVVALDTSTGAQRTVVQADDPVPGQSWRSVHVRSTDGAVVQAWLATPAGAGPFPTVIELHGGPRGVTTNTYRPDSQAWLDHGFAFVSVNHRGSTTFGTQFRDQIVGNPGQWELEDLRATYAWLLQKGIAARGRILLMGESYGGYLTLLALGQHPELWAGGIAINGIADWTTLYEETTAAGQRLAAAYFGGTPAEQAALYRDRSPITYAPQVRAPVFVIHGRQDVHATVMQMERYVRQLEQAHIPVEAMWFDGGHAGSQRIEHLERMLAFAQRVVQPQPDA